MRATILFLFFLYILGAVRAQEYHWYGKIIDSEFGGGVAKTNIISTEVKVGVTANSKGEFDVYFRFVDNKPAVFEISNVAYSNQTIVLNPAEFNNYLLKKDILLEPSIITFPAVDFSETKEKPDTIYGLPKYNIGDFCFVGDKKLLLVYSKEKRWKKAEDQNKTYFEGCHLELLDSTNRNINSYPLDGLFFGLYVEYLDEVFLTSPYNNFRILIENDEIHLEKIDLSAFEEFIAPVVDTVNGTVISSSFNPAIPAFEYYAYNLQDSILRPIHHVEDQELLAVFRSEYKYMSGRGKLDAYRYEQKTGIDKEIVAAFMTGFVSSMYVKPLYAPAFSDHDSLIIFDHYKDKIYRFDTQQALFDSVAISYHKCKRPIRWKKKIIRDIATGEFYSLFEKNGYSYLYAIDIQTGEIKDTYKLFFKYVDRIRIKNGEVFYLYRPYESSQKKFLYREKL